MPEDNVTIRFCDERHKMDNEILKKMDSLIESISHLSDFMQRCEFRIKTLEDSNQKKTKSWDRVVSFAWQLISGIALTSILLYLGLK